MKKIIISIFVSLMTFGLANAKTIDYLVTGTPGKVRTQAYGFRTH
jgi:hypothetical protein